METILFAVPFWSSWFFVVGLIISLILGFEALRITSDGLEHRTRFSRRMVPLAEVRGVGRFSQVTDSETGRIQHGMRIETWGRPVRFGQGLGDADLNRLSDLVHRHLQALAPDRTITRSGAAGDRKAAGVEVLGREAVAVELPSDSPLQAEPDWDRTAVVRRGRLSLLTLAGATFLVLFWDGIVGVFLMQLLKDFQWTLFLFLLPFEAIGLLMVVGWFAVLTAPFQVERWEFGRSEIVSRSAWMGLGRTRRVSPSDVGHIELRRPSRPVTPRGQLQAAREVDAPFSVVLVGRDGSDPIAFSRLTEGEGAGWGACAFPPSGTSSPLRPPPLRPRNCGTDSSTHDRDGRPAPLLNAAGEEGIVTRVCKSAETAGRTVDRPALGSPALGSVREGPSAGRLEAGSRCRRPRVAGRRRDHRPG